jgi:hypothetical protein
MVDIGQRKVREKYTSGGEQNFWRIIPTTDFCGLSMV